MIDNRNDEGKLYVCEGLYHFVIYPSKDKRKMTDMLKISFMVVPSYSVFGGHGCLQHACVEYVGTNNMKYPIYIFMDDVSLQDGIVLSYGWGIDVAKV